MDKTNLKIDQLVGRKFLMGFLRDVIEEVTVEQISSSGEYCKLLIGSGYQWVRVDNVIVGFIEFIDK